GPARVFATFEHSCYVETAGGIACLGESIGLGPLNAVIEGRFSDGVVDVSAVKVWKPATTVRAQDIPEMPVPESIRRPGAAFLNWLSGKGKPDDALIGLGPGLTPAGDDFVGGAMIALRAAGNVPLAERIAAWALPLAATNTNRISRAHLECAAQGEGHEALH